MTPICQEIYKQGTKLMIIDRAIEGDQYTVFYGGDNAAVRAGTRRSTSATG